MAGTALRDFQMFTDVTPGVFLSGPEEFLIESQLRSHVLSRLLESDVKKNIQGGSVIKDVMILDEPNTLTEYKPLDTFTWPNSQTTVKPERDWRFFLVPKVYSDQEIVLNSGANLSRDGLYAEWKRLADIYRGKQLTSLIDGAEALLWRNPNGEYAEMEASDGSKFTSIPAGVNEYTNGLPSGWTNFQGIPRASNANWQPTRVLYDFADFNDNDGDGDGLLDAFDEMWIKLRYMAPKIEGANRFYEEPGDARSRFIACSLNGIKLYWRTCRDRNDRTVRMNDMGVAMPEFNGVDMQEIDKLSTATLYAASGSTYNTELNAATTTRGPRFYWLDRRYLKLFFHAEYFMRNSKLPKNSAQPSGNVEVNDTWGNLWFRSSKRLGIVAPGA